MISNLKLQTPCDPNATGNYSALSKTVFKKPFGKKTVNAVAQFLPI
jgi:hypothetical protein